MHVYLNFYVHTHYKNSKKPYVINVHSRWHLAPSDRSTWSSIQLIVLVGSYMGVLWPLCSYFSFSVELASRTILDQNELLCTSQKWRENFQNRLFSKWPLSHVKKSKIRISFDIYNIKTRVKCCFWLIETCWSNRRIGFDIQSLANAKNPKWPPKL